VKLSSIKLVPYATVARELGVANKTVMLIEAVALRRVRAVFERLGYDGSEIPYVVHALAGYEDDEVRAEYRTPEGRTRRRLQDRERHRRNYRKAR
jgi:hypothetical protein